MTTLIIEKWRRRPEYIEVVTVTEENASAIADWVGTSSYTAHYANDEKPQFTFELPRSSALGSVRVEVGDQLYKDHEGKIYTATPENLKKKFKRV